MHIAIRTLLVGVFLCVSIVLFSQYAYATTLPESSVEAGDPVDAMVDRLDDPNARLDISAILMPVNQLRFRPQRSDPARCRWFRIRLPSALRRTGPWVLSADVSSATLYEPTASGYHAESFGFGTPTASMRLRNGLSNIDVLSSDYDHDLYLRIEGKPTAVLIFATLGDIESRVQQYDDQNIFFASVYLVLALAALLFSVATRGKAFAYYALYIAMQALLRALYLPFAARSIWPHVSVPYVLLQVAYGLMSPAAYFLFLRYALETRTWPRVDRLIIGCGIVSSLGFSTCYFLDEIVAFPVKATFLPYFFIATLLIGIVVTAARWRQRFTSAGFYLTGISLMTIGVIVNQFADLDTADIGFTLEAFCFLAALAFRLVSMTNERQRALSETVAAREATALEYAKRMSATELFNEAFARFVPREFLLQLGRSDVRDVALGDHVEREMTVMFCDIRSFVSFSEQMTPEEMFRFLNLYFGRLGPIVRKHGGFIDKYLGDGIMALFEGASDRALQAAAELHAEVRRLNEVRAREGERPVEIGIGLHRGPTLLATIGEKERYDTTVVADVVNLASRLEGMTGINGARIISSAAVVSAASEINAFNVRWLGEVSVHGSSASLSIYEICDGDPAESLLHKRATAATFAKALNIYRQGDYSTSRMLFEQLAAKESNDRVAAYFAERSRQRSALVDAAWDGIERQESKR